MARKSNKTAHVLGLITNNRSTSTESDSPQEMTGSSTTPLNNSSIVEMANTGNDPISELIKDELTKIIETEYPTNNVPVEEHSMENKNSNSEIILPTQTEEELINLHADEEQSEPSKMNNNHTSLITEEENSPTNSVYEHNNIDELLPEPPLSESYCCINIMEDLVQDKLSEVMNKFNVCTCPKCIKDTMAITLNHLPPKYIVTENGRLMALVNIYANQYSIIITTEIMKACMLVKESPRH